MKWFDETFLPSLFARAGVNKQLWLSAKQTAICTNYMHENRASYQGDNIGTTYTHIYYKYVWDERQVILHYSKKNGCGCIEFGYNPEEQAEANKRAVDDRWQRECEHIAFIKKKPERLERKLNQLNLRLSSLHEALADINQYIAEENDPDDIERANYILSQIEETKKELAKYNDN